jgi:streptogramin lyase
MRYAKLLVLAAALALVPSSAMAAPTLDGTFTPSGQPKFIAPGPDGNVWFGLSGSTTNKEYGKVAPDGTITEYDTPTNGRALAGVTGGPNGHVWFTYDGGVLEVDPATGAGTEHAIATLTGPRGITTDADGNLWAVALDRVIKVAPNGTGTDFLIGQVAGRGIARGSDGRLYLADFGSQSIKAFTTASPNTPQTIALGIAPQEIAAGPAGQLGVGLPSNDMARVGTDGAVVKTTDAGTDAFGVTFGNDGAYWFAQFATNTLGRLQNDGAYSKPITFPAGTGPRYIATGANNTLWVTAETSKKILRISGVEPPPPPATTTTDPPGTTTTPPPPPPDTVAPVLTAAKVNAKTRSLSITLSEPATLAVVVEQKIRNRRTRKNRWSSVRAAHAQGKAGANKVSLGKKKLKPGTYRVRVTATDAAGNASKKTLSFKVSAASARRR